MAKKHKKHLRVNRGKINTKVVLGIVAVLVALPFAINSALQQTSFRQQAAFPSIIDDKYTNLNTASDIVSTVNKDGTMGPQTAASNWSSSLPINLKGSLAFSLTGTDYGANPSVSPSYNGYDRSYDTKNNKGKGNYGNSQKKNGKSNDYDNNTRPTSSYGVTAYPSQANKNYGPQEITALNLTITKVEVHLANFVSPGDKKNDKQQNAYGRPSDSPKNQTGDHWETLNITNPTTINILQKNAASQLGLTYLAAGKYTQVRLYLSKATATLVDGTTVDLQLLNKDNVIKVVKPFTIEAGKTTYLTMDIDAKHSIVKANDMYILKPVIGKMVEGQAATY